MTPSHGTRDDFPVEEMGDYKGAMGELPDGFVVATKADLDPATGDFSADQVRRSVERSLELLGLDRLPLVYLHDPYRISFEEGTGPGGTLDGLLAARDEGLVDHIGIAEGGVELARRYVATGAFEAMITHNRWTLVDRSAGPLLEDAAERDLGISNAAVFGGGILVRGVEAARGRYAYHDASDVVLDHIRRMEQACTDHGVALPAAALRSSLREPGVTSTIVGVSDPSEVAAALAWARTDIPDLLWDELDRLLPPAEHWQG
jgi:D-threo-aldose 1-dehydrogenase